MSTLHSIYGNKVAYNQNTGQLMVNGQPVGPVQQASTEVTFTAAAYEASTAVAAFPVQAHTQADAPVRRRGRP